MNAEELRIKQFEESLSIILAKSNATEYSVALDADAVTREIWKNFPKDVNFIASSRSRYAVKKFLESRNKVLV